MSGPRKINTITIDDDDDKHSEAEEEADDQLLCCTICLDLYSDPRVLPCGHTNCLQCLHGMQQAAAGDAAIYCTQCRNRTAVRVQMLPVNYVVKQLVEKKLEEKAKRKKMKKEEEEMKKMKRMKEEMMRSNEQAQKWTRERLLQQARGAAQQMQRTQGPPQNHYGANFQRQHEFLPQFAFEQPPQFVFEQLPQLAFAQPPQPLQPSAGHNYGMPNFQPQPQPCFLR